MFHRHPHHRHGPGNHGHHGHHGRRFAREERGQDREERHRGHGRHGRGSDLRRIFAHGDLRLVILHLIAEKPRHGYEIIKAIEDRVGGAYSPSPGVIYPTLTLLEELGYVAIAAAEGARKLHAITPQGRAFMEANAPALTALLARMDEAVHAQTGGTTPAIHQAVEHLKHAIRHRLGRGPLTDEQANEAAAAINAAADTVEKL